MELEAGPQTDSLIARKLWKALVVTDTETGEDYMVGEKTHEKVPVPKFSTDTDEAHRIVSFFQSKGWMFRVKNIPEEDTYQACFFRQDNRRYLFVKEQSLPMAICVAAFAALNGTNIKH